MKDMSDKILNVFDATVNRVDRVCRENYGDYRIKRIDGLIYIKEFLAELEERGINYLEVKDDKDSKSE